MIGTHKEQALFERSRWRKRILLPCWIVQIPILLTLMGIFSNRLFNTVKSFKDEQGKGGIPMVEFVWECANISFSAVSFVVNLVQIAKFIAEALTPFGMLFGNVVSLTLSSAILALDIVVYVQFRDKNYSTAALALDCALLFFTIVPIIYGVRVYRRIASYDEYHHPHNVKHYGFAQEQDTSYDPWRMSLSHDPEALYDPTNPSATEPRRPSFTFRRSISGASDTRRASVSPGPQPSDERKVSYDHKRDTQFDEYVAKRASTELKRGVDRALGAESGWEGKAHSDSISDSGKAQMLQVQPRSRGNSLTRPVSWEINLGDAPGTPGAGVQRGHSLISVPEGPEPEEEDTGRLRGKHRPVSEDRQGLLGNHRASTRSVASYASTESRLEVVHVLDDVELDSKSRRRDS